VQYTTAPASLVLAVLKPAATTAANMIERIIVCSCV
jgi:hypothetical protein